ncbi:hypothetical protein OG992_29110 [Micromonospora sp. NBC_00362]|uniref:hypothetical protein n=1 Tax=Micromonospora sp. NBC_00362 TaxID=2975975 RepID=UPI0022551E08|nr:hypothetical protein [Micromonospora sp. NBC_00362]MCX5121245.1 hypothetical protein [Micromonospora sp. NBC_00362]
MSIRIRPRPATSPTWPTTDDHLHPDWCARGHLCGMGEHRAQPVTLRVPGRGVVVLTRVLAADGSQHAEIRTRISLAAGDTNARAHLMRIVTEFDAALRRMVRPQRRTP